MVHNRDYLRVVVLVLVCLVPTSNAFPQGTQNKIKTEPQRTSPDLREIIRVHSDLIVLSVTVRDRNGHLASGLKQEDFHVFDEGVEQTITAFADQGLPLSLAILVDSTSTGFPVYEELRDLS